MAITFDTFQGCALKEISTERPGYFFGQKYTLFSYPIFSEQIGQQIVLSIFLVDPVKTRERTEEKDGTMKREVT